MSDAKLAGTMWAAERSAAHFLCTRLAVQRWPAIRVSRFGTLRSDVSTDTVLLSRLPCPNRNDALRSVASVPSRGFRLRALVRRRPARKRQRPSSGSQPESFGTAGARRSRAATPPALRHGVRCARYGVFSPVAGMLGLGLHPVRVAPTHRTAVLPHRPPHPSTAAGPDAAAVARRLSRSCGASVARIAWPPNAVRALFRRRRCRASPARKTILPCSKRDPMGGAVASETIAAHGFFPAPCGAPRGRYALKNPRRSGPSRGFGPSGSQRRAPPISVRYRKGEWSSATS